MTYYGKIEAGAEREPAADGSKLHAGQALGESGNRTEAPPRRSHWAWAAAKGHHDWMDSHTPFARHE
ncbi:hypothetical protein GCM10027081_61760 [Cupriavidus yeoncheonensis]